MAVYFDLEKLYDVCFVCIEKNEFNDGRLYATLTYVIIIVCGKKKFILLYILVTSEYLYGYI
jgi:hypothetical protein